MCVVHRLVRREEANTPLTQRRPFFRFLVSIASRRTHTTEIDTEASLSFYPRNQMSKGSSSSMSSSGQQLIDACISGNLTTVRKLLDEGVNVNLNHHSGYTALMKASIHGHVEVLKLLLERGAEVNIQNKFKGTGLMIASYHGKVECVRLLLERGADMSLKDEHGKTAKDKAVQRGYVSIVHLLNEYEAKKQNTPQAQQLTEAQLPQAQVLGKKKNAPKPHTQAKKQNTPQAQLLTEVELPQAQVLGELVMEPINKALQEENGRLKAENGILKEREICKQELMDEYKARAKNMEEEIQRAKDEIQRGKDEIQRFRDEVTSLKEKEIRLAVENEYLKRRDEELRLVRTAESEYYKRRDEELRLELNAFQTTMSSLMNGMEDRKRKRNDDDDAE